MGIVDLLILAVLWMLSCFAGILLFQSFQGWRERRRKRDEYPLILRRNPPSE